MADPLFNPYRTSYATRDGRPLTIRPVTIDDAAAFQEIASGDHAVWGTMQMPMTLPAVRRAQLEANETNTDNWFIGAELEGKLVGGGNLQTNSRRVRARHCGYIGMSVHDDFRGQGIGTAVLSALLDLADNWLNLRRIELHVYTDNKAGIRLYSSHDFVIEGTHVDYSFRGGSYVDAHTMARVRPRP